MLYISFSCIPLVGAAFFVNPGDATYPDRYTRYADLQRAYGTNCTSAKAHWEKYGKQEGRDPSCEEVSSTTNPLNISVISEPKKSGPIVTVKISGGKAPYYITVPEGLQYLGNSLAGATIQSSSEEIHTSTMHVGNEEEKIMTPAGVVGIADIGVVERDITQAQAEQIEYYFANTTTNAPEIQVRDANQSTQTKKIYIYEGDFFSVKKGDSRMVGGSRIIPTGKSYITSV